MTDYADLEIGLVFVCFEISPAEFTEIVQHQMDCYIEAGHQRWCGTRHTSLIGLQVTNRVAHNIRSTTIDNRPK